MNCSIPRRAVSGLIASTASSSSRTIPRHCRINRQARNLSLTSRRPAAQSTANSNLNQVSHDLSPSADSEPLRSLTDGLSDPPPVLDENERQVDWTRSFHGLSSSPFTPEQSEVLQQRLDYDDIEIKPDGIVYLPEIKYRRILNRAFGPGGWGLAPRGETIVTGKVVTREYGLVAGGRLISIARGEQTYFDPDGIPTATEGCKSNALMRCCKDLGIASELWDPRFIKKFMAEMGKECMVEHAVTKKRRKHWMRKDDELKWPLKEVSVVGSSVAEAASKAYGQATAGMRAAAPKAVSASGTRAAPAVAKK